MTTKTHDEILAGLADRYEAAQTGEKRRDIRGLGLAIATVAEWNAAVDAAGARRAGA